MTIPYNNICVHVHLDRIRANYRVMQSKAPSCIGVIKSDAYGHGLLPVASALGKAGARTLAVGTVGEAIRLRKGGFEGKIIALLGALSSDEACSCRIGRITPFVYSLEQLQMLSAACTNTPINVGLKFDTGMARLGFSEAQLPEVTTALKQLRGIKVSIVASHLAVSDEPEKQRFTDEQQATFRRIVQALREAGHQFEASLANSAALLSRPDLHHDLQRPGIALYGSNPLHGTELAHMGASLQPAMEVSAPVLQVHSLAKGRSISYGRTFVAPHDMTVAIIGIGYADAFSRGLSNAGSMIINEQRAPILGRVCMQMTAVDITHIPAVSAGNRAWVLGGPGPKPITAEELAAAWGTISYEVFCLLGQSPKTFAGE